MNMWDYIILAAVALSVFLAVRHIRKAGHAGCSGCCASCHQACAHKKG